MIKLIKNTTSSFCIQMDVEGINETLKYLKTMNIEENSFLQSMYLESEIKLRIELSMFLDEIRISKDNVTIYMDYEEKEYYEQRLEDALVCGYFYPAEICERKYKNSCATLYCDIV